MKWNNNNERVGGANWVKINVESQVDILTPLLEGTQLAFLWSCISALRASPHVI